METAGYPLHEFAQMTGGTLLYSKDDVARVSYIVTDSRHFQNRPESVFFALKSARNDGHNYAADMLARGMQTFVVSDASVAEALKTANVILVENTLEALQKLAGRHRAAFDIPVLAITGSNGKTVVKEWLYQLMSRHLRVMRSPRSYNSQLGVALSLWQLHSAHQLAILEAGISHPGEMQRLAAMIQPTLGIFTNIGSAHQENFSALSQKIDEKLALFAKVKTLLYCRDHELVHERIEAQFGQAGPKRYTWSTRQPADLTVQVTRHSSRAELIAHFQERRLTVSCPFVDAASLENACHCLLYLLLSEMSDTDIASGMAALSPIAMRLEQLNGVHGSTLINDVYNSDYTSLEIAVDQLMLQRKNKRYTAIVSDLVQSGEAPATLYAKVADMLRRKGVDQFIGIGDDLHANQSFFTGISSRFFISTDAFLEAYRHEDFGHQNILVKGARKFAFERITDILSEKTHETILEIDLERIRDNLNFIRSMLSPKTGIIVMVKAFGYGSGSYEVAQTLEFYGVQYLAVAYADEGIELREAGITMPIMVLNPELSSYDAMLRYKLEPQIFSFRTLEKFTEALFSRDSVWPYPIHIKINTGMNRLGFDPGEVEELGKRLSANDAVKVETVFSHLAASESATFDSLTNLQIERFEKACLELRKSLNYPFKKHLVNSEGIFRFPGQHFDMVRLGLALYGITGNAAIRKHLKPVSRLITTVSQVRVVAAGEGVGYSPKSPLAHEAKIAVVPVGYADGLPRALGNGVGHVYIAGRRHPFVGNICMDMAMVDVTGTGCSEGDEVEIFGDNMNIYEMAEHLNTIPYEVLTNISQRVKRKYLHQ